ncbi:hypothetical protein AXF42_Ash017646 [Apostasia shenzhenica]|uniref:AB hydrolase-1 domain-containing protein n=1 Tax=Apostasia shenzhenica TaxID=1088818 RepID=A0A2I0A5E2_9ASPA|nr:hypothetical protein AXF42_Ash017646 [Apostasia shenzhenica]
MPSLRSPLRFVLPHPSPAMVPSPSPPPPPCLSFTAYRDWCYSRSFLSAGLRPSVVDLDGGRTTIRCWSPLSPDPESRPSLLLIHGFGANAMWQWASYVRSLLRAGFDLYIPDLLFFGGSVTTRFERNEVFQAECVMAAIKAMGVQRLRAVVGVSYGGFVGHRIAAMYPAAVERVVLICAGVCLEEKDLGEGMFVVNDLAEAASILVPQTPERLRQLVRLSHCRPPPLLPTCFLADYIHVSGAEPYHTFWNAITWRFLAMCTDYVDEKTELIFALIRDRKLSDLPKISQASFYPVVVNPTLIIWGEQDRIFPLELGRRLKRHLEGNSQIAVIKNAGHAVNLEKSKELCKHLKAFVVDPSGQEFHKHKATRWYSATKCAGEVLKKFASHLHLPSGQREKSSRDELLIP